MALSFATPQSGDQGTPISDLNTTPLIDVMLVLLIMFIITIPIQTHSVGINLPQAPVDTCLPRPDPIKNKVTIDASGTVRWNGMAVDPLTLRRYLAQTLAMPVEPELQFQPDAAARYLVVDQTLADIRRSGVTKLGFVGNEQYGHF
jgi:biopolymer transport protein ExbD